MIQRRPRPDPISFRQKGCIKRGMATHAHGRERALKHRQVESVQIIALRNDGEVARTRLHDVLVTAWW